MRAARSRPSSRASTSAADPVEDATSTHERSANITPIGYSARVVPTSGTGSGFINSDLAFQGKYAYQGTYNGFRVLDVSNPREPRQAFNYTGCTTGQGDVVVYKNVLVRSWDSPVSAGGAATQSCGGALVGQGFEGIHIFDISNPEAPTFVRGLRLAAAGNPDGSPTGCGSHTASAVPDEARGYLYIYNGGSSGSCTGIEIIKIKLSDPTDAVTLRRANAQRQCHDNTILMGGANSYAVCAGGNGFSVFKFDTTKDPAAEGGIENPTFLYSKPVSGVSIGHSSMLSYDGKTIVYGHEPGGGTNPRCRTTDTIVDRSLYFFDTETGDQISTLLHPRFQTQLENCTWHNFNTVPTLGANIGVSGNYQAGIYVVDFTDRTAPKVIAHADPTPLPKTPTGGDPDGGDWSTYWHNGYIYESDIYRGLMIWELDNSYTKRAKTVETSNPQTQVGTYVGDNDKPTAAIAAPVAGGQFLQNSQQLADYSCADVGLGIESCTGNVADGAAIDTSKIGYHTFTVTATDKAGNITTQSVEYVVNSTAVTSVPAGTVAATLSLAMGPAASFGAFTPGVAREYNASTSANVISTAGDAALSVSDPGRLANGTFTLAQPLQVSFSKSAWTAPVSNDLVTISFRQAIGANEALRTGTYSKTLTFTLSTTTP